MDDELRPKLWDIMSRRNEKILAAQKTNAIILPYFEADNEAADEIIALTAATVRAELEKLLEEKDRYIVRKAEVKSGFIDGVPIAIIEAAIAIWAEKEVTNE